MLQLARLYLTVDDLDACQQQCVQLLKMDAENDDATVVSKTTFARRAKSKTFFFFVRGQYFVVSLSWLYSLIFLDDGGFDV